MTKKIRAILPEYAYEMIMDIIKNQGLDKREKLISEQLKNSTDPEIVKSLIDDRPLYILSIIARKAVEKELSEEEVISLLMEKLRIEKEKAEKINIELQKKVIFFTEPVEIEKAEKEKKEIKNQEKIKEEEEKKETLKKKITKKEVNVDPYREIIE